MLRRRPVQASEIRRIGKEANKLDDVEAGLVGHLGEVLNNYGDGGPSLFRACVLPVLDDYSGRELARLVGTNRRTIDRIRNGAEPRPDLREKLVALARDQPLGFAEEDLAEQTRKDVARRRMSFLSIG